MLQRVRFFSGQLLAADDFETEQTYQREKWRLHNRMLHGVGIVEGLGVTADDESPDAVVVSPGFALDGLGNEIVVYDPVSVPLIACASEACFVTIQYAETPAGPVPAPGGGSEFSRVTEGFSIDLAAADPAGLGTSYALGLARLARRHGRWSVDVSYRPERLRRNRD